MLLILLWILGTLAITCILLMLGKTYGVSVLISCYACLIVMAQVFAGKLVLFGNYIVPAAVIVYGVSFLITDVIVEFYNKRQAMKAIYCGFAGSLLLVTGIQIVMAWPGPEFQAGFQEAFKIVLGPTWRIVLASLVSYLISQTWDVYAFSKIKQLTKGKHLWLRNMGSTISSQAIDTLIFITIAFAGTMSGNILISMIIGQYLVKLIIATFDTPFLYLLRGVYKWIS